MATVDDYREKILEYRNRADQLRRSADQEGLKPRERLSLRNSAENYDCQARKLVNVMEELSHAPEIPDRQ
jgi:hypothetical protein